MFFDINKGLCEAFNINPLELLYYPADDVFELIEGTIDYNSRNEKDKKPTTTNSSGTIRRAAGDNWF